jgi:hypothetical protein
MAPPILTCTLSYFFLCTSDKQDWKNSTVNYDIAAFITAQDAAAEAKKPLKTLIEEVIRFQKNHSVALSHRRRRER